ncbi:KPN_02809 family neutral zinc metallopeptidase [Nocardioides sp.]|uniref:KPN_02809 family neutral zinc metallopeptidase n=1 Tax=Nocardioides sp. TaxID=35761 RepID=UPI003D0A9030
MSDGGGRSGGGGGLGGGQIQMPGGMKAGGGVAGIVIILIIVAVNYLMGGQSPAAGGSLDSGQMVAEGADSGRYDNCRTGEDAATDPDCARVLVENSLRDYWAATLPEQAGIELDPATMETFTGAINTGCGQATSAVGPFYCPPDQRIYLDTTFFADVLQQQLNGPAGDFVEPYVIGHEYGHHIQNLMGTMSRVKTQQGPRSDAVRLELQADCYAGMWVKAATSTQDATGEPLILELTDQDIREAIAAASAVGDDKIQQQTQGQVTKETWTHGSAASRMKWFQTGYQQGSLQACDTWAVDTP